MVTPPQEPEDLIAAVTELAEAPLAAALTVPTKMERRDAKKRVRQDLMEALAVRFADNPERLKNVPEILEDLEKKIVRQRILTDKVRIDGRDLTTVCSLIMEVGVLPCTHGSAIFARGETKALATCTLGSTRDKQHIKTLTGKVG